jgi:hypothetical protein
MDQLGQNESYYIGRQRRSLVSTGLTDGAQITLPDIGVDPLGASLPIPSSWMIALDQHSEPQKCGFFAC